MTSKIISNVELRMSMCTGSRPSTRIRFAQFTCSIPQTVRQIHFDSPLIQIDLFQILLREWDQRFFILAIDLQNFRAARVEHVGDRSEYSPSTAKTRQPFN